MSQIVFTAKEAKNNFGRLLDEARRSPVAIQKNGRKVAYVLSNENYADYEDFEAIIDAYWGEKAKKAAKGGYLTVAQTEKLLRSALNVKR
ncbi:MAG TPA: type II toxin-antitoxin system Phd/YefM family antitoxin [Candidatus Paceibacterota bacterium]